MAALRSSPVLPTGSLTLIARFSRHSTSPSLCCVPPILTNSAPLVSNLSAFSNACSRKFLHASKSLAGLPLQWHVSSRSIAQKAGTVKAAVAAPVEKPAGADQKPGYGVRVRFAPSPTGNLHVGGARTALFNWLFARAQGGKFILRVEDTDQERSTRASEDAMVRDLRWLGLDWDEGPDVGGDFGPYRQSERVQIYKECVDKLLAAGHLYPCFCTDEELDAMRKEAEEKKLPPKYTGKWATASKEEVDAELAKGTPHTYRFRVPQEGRLVIQDLIRGEVGWDFDTLGDFIVMRSNGMPVYNFCVAVDDATMHISHVIRAEEHLPNTLRQALIYKALGYDMPKFAHCSIILAPDRSKLSKRHGATSVGEFKQQGFLSEAMVNYLALLGWNDGTEEEIFSAKDLVERFTIERITKSSAIFDKTKLGWMNGQHIRGLPEDKINSMLEEQWLRSGLLSRSDGPFVEAAAGLLKGGLNVVSEADDALKALVAYPLEATLAGGEVNELLEDNLGEVAAAAVAAFDSGKLQETVKGGHDAWKAWLKDVGKALKRKGKRLFMPMRVVLTGSNKGPDVGELLALLSMAEEKGVLTSEAGFVDLSSRIQALRDSSLMKS